MTFDDIAAGAAVFLDANTFIYHFSNHPKYGPASTALVERIERQEIRGFTSSHCIADVAHRLMTIEAMGRLGWPAAGLAARLRKNHFEIPNLTLYQQAIAQIGQLGIQVVAVTDQLVSAATSFSRQYELLTGDALIVAAMRQLGLTDIASQDDDFDREPGLTRYSPI
jgi:predicted nucleic acid-binding protein